jgi:nicotinamidase/pyrazinamidase
MNVALQAGDVLVVVDVQVDFVSGSLAVPGAAAVLPAVNHCIERFAAHALPVVATRDWHPATHVSFRPRGPWPPHCVGGTPGAAFAPGLRLPERAHVVDKAATPDRDAYSGFEGTRLAALLERLGARRLFVCGLATDYCVLATVRDALRLGYAAFVVRDAIRAVDVRSGDGEAALREMEGLGARLLEARQVDAPVPAHG